MRRSGSSTIKERIAGHMLLIMQRHRHFLLAAPTKIWFVSFGNDEKIQRYG